MFSPFNPSKWSSGQPTLRCPGRSWGFGALLTSVIDTSCQSRDLNPQPWVTSGFKSNALSIRPQLPCICSVSSMLDDTLKLTECIVCHAIMSCNECFNRGKTAAIKH